MPTGARTKNIPETIDNKDLKQLDISIKKARSGFLLNKTVLYIPFLLVHSAELRFIESFLMFNRVWIPIQCPPINGRTVLEFY
jgi:hypothetical protein